MNIKKNRIDLIYTVLFFIEKIYFIRKQGKCKNWKMKQFRQSTQRIRDYVEWVELIKHIPFKGDINSYEDCAKHIE